MDSEGKVGGKQTLQQGTTILRTAPINFTCLNDIQAMLIINF